MKTRANPFGLLALTLLGFLAGACGDTLLDHRASPELLGPVCAANQVSCGGTCLTCTTPANAHPVCGAGNACAFACDGGFNACPAGGSACVAESATSCGASCTDCTAGIDVNATGTCSAATHACEVTCKAGYIASGATCQLSTSVAAGFLHTCALLADHTVKCWGANFLGQLGQGHTTELYTPVNVPLPGPASGIVSGYLHSCAIVDRSAAAGSAGEVWCWGQNSNGQVGNGSANAMEPSPVEALGLTGVRALGAGASGLTQVPSGHTCAILADRSLSCWGAGTSGQLGDGGTTSHGTPVAVTILPAGTQAVEVTGGEGHTCARTTTGAVYCWGANDKGQLGIGGTGAQTAPATAAVPSGATAIAVGDLHACAIVGGTLECWGYNGFGQVDATTAATITTYTVPHASGGLGGGFTPAVVGAGRAHTCAAKALDLPKCFGDNTYGQVGQLGNPSDAPMIGAVANLGNGSDHAITGGSDHTCVLTTTGGVLCWGRNDHGQLGRGATSNSEAAGAFVSGR